LPITGSGGGVKPAGDRLPGGRRARNPGAVSGKPAFPPVSHIPHQKVNVPAMSKQSPIAVVLGTRPEIIKLAPVINQLGGGVRVVHTGQHYSEPMSGQVSADLDLPAAAVNLGLGGTDRGAQLGSMISALTREFGNIRPAAVVVQGDTTSALAGALAANAGDIPLCHVEAGLRSFDRAMPEEHNRILVDHLADLCFAPTETSGANLAAENIAPERVQITGNTIVDALQNMHTPSTSATDTALRQLGLTRDRFALTTLHRPENVDQPDVLELLLKQLNALPLPVLLPLHPRTEQRVIEFGLVALLDGLHVTGPLRYPDFLALAPAACRRRPVSSSDRSSSCGAAPNARR
jgi:UDP-N-acetylglucosamine 2-epimerase (non-hydrolysing)